MCDPLIGGLEIGQGERKLFYNMPIRKYNINYN